MVASLGAGIQSTLERPRNGLYNQSSTEQGTYLYNGDLQETLKNAI